MRPGARPQDIRLAYRGADGAAGRRRRRAADRHRARRRCATRRRSPSRIGGAGAGRAGTRSSGQRVRLRRSARYDPARELIIDPGLAYSTFLGGTSHEIGAGIAVDAAGNAYVTGFTQSPNFPTTAGAFDRTGAASNNLDVFVTKLNPTGTALVYSTFIGGTNFDWGRGHRRRLGRQRVRDRPDRSPRTSRRPAARSTARSTSTTARAAASTSTTRSSPSSTPRARRSSTRRSSAAPTSTTASASRSTARATRT